MKKDAAPSTDTPNQILNGPLGKLISGIVPKEQLEKLGSDIGGSITWLRETLEIHTRQNMRIIAQQDEILALLKGSKDDDDNSGRDANTDDLPGIN
jgi:hypothetical protein